MGDIEVTLDSASLLIIEGLNLINSLSATAAPLANAPYCDSADDVTVTYDDGAIPPPASLPASESSTSCHAAPSEISSPPSFTKSSGFNRIIFAQLSATLLP